MQKIKINSNNRNNKYENKKFINYCNIVKNNQSLRQLMITNNPYNFIIPNFKLLKNDPLFKQLHLNGFKKLLYDNKEIYSVSHYNSLYPENFYHIWEILNEFNIIDVDCKKIIFIDDGICNPLGHMESTMLYCQKVLYSQHEFIRLCFNEDKELKKKDLQYHNKFISIYNNHKLYDFANDQQHTNINDKIKNYFSTKETRFDFAMGFSNKMCNNLLLLSIVKEKSNAVVYIDDYLDGTIDELINEFVHNYEEAFIYQPEIQDKFDTSCFLILKRYKNKSTETKNTTNINEIRQKYYEDLNDHLLAIYDKSIDYEYMTPFYINLENDDLKENINKCYTWCKKYDIPFKTNNSINILDSLIINNNKYYSYLFEKNLCDFENIIFTNDSVPIKQLYSIKRDLEYYKKIVNTKEKFVNNNLEYNIIDWNKFNNSIYLYTHLCKIIMWKSNAELVDNSWINIYEILTKENIIEQIKTNNIKSFHICETSGSSISVLNHYIKTKTNKTLQWYAQCPYYKDNFKGKYDLITLMPNNWLKYKNNDIEDITTIDKYVKNNKYKELLDLDIIICENKYHNEEKQYLRLILCQIYSMIELLPKGKMFIIKMFLPLSDPTIVSILYLLTSIYQKIKIVKPMSNCLNNLDVYCICFNYIGRENIPERMIKRIRQLINDNDINNTIIPINFIDNDFIDKLIKIIKELTNVHINYIEYTLNIRDAYYTNYDLQNDHSILKEKVCNNWLNDMNIEKIQDKDKLFV